MTKHPSAHPPLPSNHREVEALLPVHDALQDGGEWCDADTSPDQDGVL